MQLRIASEAVCHVNVQGGTMYLAAYFGGRSIVVDFYGADDARAAPAARARRRRRLYENGATYSHVLPRLSNQTLRRAGSVEEVLDELDRWRADGVCGFG